MPEVRMRSAWLRRRAREGASDLGQYGEDVLLLDERPGLGDILGCTRLVVETRDELELPAERAASRVDVVEVAWTPSNPDAYGCPTRFVTPAIPSTLTVVGRPRAPASVRRCRLDGGGEQRGGGYQRGGRGAPASLHRPSP
jgi:hypothetical protein